MKHLFLTEPLERLNLALDTSMRLAASFAQLDCEIFHAAPDDLSWRLGGKASIRASRLQFGQGFDSRYVTCPPDLQDDDPLAKGLYPDKATNASKLNLPLEFFDVIHLRQDPPFDNRYLATTWMLDEARRQGVHIVNDPSAVRSYNEKLAPLLFPDDSIDCIVSSSPTELSGFYRHVAKGNLVIKPLHLFGGQGVEHVQGVDGSDDELNAYFARRLAKWGVVVACVFANAIVEQGEVRVFAVTGKPLAYCLKKPAEGSFLANTAAGARLLEYQPPASLAKRLEAVATKLDQLGLHLVGFDVIGGMISEINLTSPRLLVPEGHPVAPAYHQAAKRLMERFTKEKPAQPSK